MTDTAADPETSAYALVLTAPTLKLISMARTLADPETWEQIINQPVTDDPEMSMIDAANLVRDKLHLVLAEHVLADACNPDPLSGVVLLAGAATESGPTGTDPTPVPSPASSSTSQPKPSTASTPTSGPAQESAPTE